MRSDRMKKGLERAPHRSLFKALGLTDQEIERPMIGIANSANEVIQVTSISINFLMPSKRVYEWQEGLLWSSSPLASVMESSWAMRE